MGLRAINCTSNMHHQYFFIVAEQIRFSAFEINPYLFCADMARQGWQLNRCVKIGRGLLPRIRPVFPADTRASLARVRWVGARR